MKELLGLLAVIIAITGHIPYILDTIHGKTKPHLFSWLTWAVIISLSFFGQWSRGAGAGSWSTAVTGVIVIIIAILAIKKGTKDITFVDKFLFIAALITIIPWYLTNDPTLSVIMATIVDACAFILTIRKTIKDPSSETLVTYSSNVLRNALSIFALSQYNVVTLIYPSYSLIVNIIMTAIILRPKLLQKQKKRVN